MINVSIIIPVKNGGKWINNCFQSIKNQTVLNRNIQIEIVVFNDGSDDDTAQLLNQWQKTFITDKIDLVITGSAYSVGVGAAKNGAVKKSRGTYLCFHDVDDIMLPERISLQLKAAQVNHNALVGSKVTRTPEDSTPRFVNWANNLTQDQLKLQVYTSNGPTLLMPTWFCHRSVYDRVGGFDETGAGTPEDLIFFYAHLDNNGDLIRVDEVLVVYTYHEGATTFSVLKENIYHIQLQRLERLILPLWKQFTIWNAGKAGRKLIRSLKPETQKKVIAFCDVDRKKIRKNIELYCPIKRKILFKVFVKHFSEVEPPLLICMKLNLTNGEFEKNLKSLNLIEGKDYYIFN